MQRHHGARRRPRLAEGDIRDRAAAAEHTDASPSPPGVDGEGLDDIVSGGDFKDVGAERIGAVTRDDNRRLRLVLGAWRSAAGAAVGGGSASGAGGGGVFLRWRVLGICRRVDL